MKIGDDNMKAHCLYCGMVDDMKVAERGCYSDGNPVMMNAFVCTRCGRRFWQKDTTDNENKPAGEQEQQRPVKR